MLSEILAEISGLGPMLPGSIRKTTQKKADRDGHVKVYPSSPIYTYTDRATGKQRNKRVNPRLYARVLELTRNYARFVDLLKEYDDVLVHSNYPLGSKKNF